MQDRYEDARRFLSILFAEGELFEVRSKSKEQRGSTQVWYTFTEQDVDKLVRSHLPIWERGNKSIWVGVCTRQGKQDATPSKGRVLWVDFNDDITTPDEASAAIKIAGLPYPTLSVCSGNGMHAYWVLDTLYDERDLRAYARGIHEALPSDNTHDTARVMRLPGTINPKDPENPLPCYIVENTGERHNLAIFPKVEAEVEVQDVWKPVERQDLPLGDLELFEQHWVDGQRHELCLAIAGYLRKELGWSEEETLRTIQGIQRRRGFEVDDSLRHNVRTTYELPWGKIAGLSKLVAMGVKPENVPGFRMRVAERKAIRKPLVELIDFTTQIEPQKFWVDGLVGPGLMTLWVGAPKTGKSFAVMQLAHALSVGYDLWDFKVNGPRRVLYFQGELSQGMVYERAMGMFHPDTLGDIRQLAMSDKPEEPLSLLEHPEALTDIAEHYDVIIVDPITAFNSLDENSRVGVKETLGIFAKLKKDNKAIVLVHHTRKLDTKADGSVKIPTMNDIRGSNEWRGAVDATALHYPWGNSGHTQVAFEFRAARDREPLPLYRMPNGGFTHDKRQYLEMREQFRGIIRDRPIHTLN